MELLYSIHSINSKALINRWLLAFGAFIFIMVSFFIIWYAFILSAYLIVMILYVKNYEFIVYTDRLELVEKSIWSKFDCKEIFQFSDIKILRFDKAFFDVTAVLLNPDFQPTISSKKDTIEIVNKDGTWRSINRIGEKEIFKIFSVILIDAFNKWNDSLFTTIDKSKLGDVTDLI